jgi:hypothetical protein
MGRIMRFVIVIMGALAALLVVVVALSLGVTSAQNKAKPAVSATVEDFLRDVADGDSLAAYQLFASSVKGTTITQTQIDML